jgi:zinc protease
LISFENDGLFLIASEVGSDVCSAALKEIYFEIERLQTELVPDEELDLVRNYMLGNMLRNMEGPFDLMERYKEIEFSSKGYDYYDEYITVIKKVSSTDIQNLANKYLKKSDLLELVVGKMD